MTEETFEFNDKGLKALMKAFKEPPKVKVGILGDEDGRTDGNSNANIGRRHEFGLGVPQRSFLRQPLMENFQQYVEDSNAFDEQTIKKVIQEKSIGEWMKKIGVIAETIIQDAFDSEGFGKWKPSNMANKQNHQTLVETQQLRNSIASEVTEEKS